eukprot:TRINITY_DN3228_c0_g1_i1.p1 TRINITY_DN3228_c0_g1~~TRINITY_DN3228_c0_g1_i1.p1  ORF type:complete len:186 (-),score=51.51 TRINITY_DN3228_c0_g1_i1:83-640(-)
MGNSGTKAARQFGENATKATTRVASAETNTAKKATENVVKQTPKPSTETAASSAKIDQEILKRLELKDKSLDINLKHLSNMIVSKQIKYENSPDGTKKPSQASRPLPKHRDSVSVDLESVQKPGCLNTMQVSSFYQDRRLHHMTASELARKYSIPQNLAEKLLKNYSDYVVIPPREKEKYATAKI